MIDANKFDLSQYKHVDIKTLKQRAKKYKREFNRFYAYCELILREPHIGNHYRERGRILTRWGANSYDDAIDDFDKAIDINPSDYLAYFYRSEVFARMGQFTQAHLDLRQTLALNPDFHQVYLWTGMYLVLEDDLYSGMISCEYYVSLMPDCSDGYQVLGDIYRRMNAFADAVFCLEQAIALNPLDAHAYGSLGTVYGMLGNKAEAIRHYEIAVSLKPRYHYSQIRLFILKNL